MLLRRALFFLFSKKVDECSPTSGNFTYLCLDISKGCLTIRLRLYPLNRIRVMPRPG